MDVKTKITQASSLPDDNDDDEEEKGEEEEEAFEEAVQESNVSPGRVRCRQQIREEKERLMRKAKSTISAGEGGLWYAMLYGPVDVGVGVRLLYWEANASVFLS